MKRYFWYLIQIFMIYAVCITVILIVNPYAPWKAYFLMWLLTLEIWMCMWLFLNALRRRFDEPKQEPKIPQKTTDNIFLWDDNERYFLFSIFDIERPFTYYKCNFNLSRNEVELLGISNGEPYLLQIQERDKQRLLRFLKEIPGIDLDGDRLLFEVDFTTRNIVVRNELVDIVAMSK